MADFNFGGAFAQTEGQLQRNEQSRQSAPYELQHLQATIRASNAYADLTEAHVQADKRMREVMSTTTLDPQASQSAQLLQLGGAAMKAGDTVTARDLMLRAGQAQAQEARVAAAQATQKRQEAELHIKMADRYHQLLSGVKDQESLDAANRTFQAEFGEEAPVMNYDPKGLKVLQDSTIKYRDKVYAEHAKAMEELAARRERAREGEAQQRIRIRQADLERKREKDKAPAKEGGKDVGAPSKSEIDEAKALIKSENKSKGLDDEATGRAAFDLASRAKALRRQQGGNPALSASEAQQRAFVDQVAEGFYTTEASTTFGVKTGEKAGFRTGASAESALPAPKDLNTLKPKKYYQTPKGPLLYLGNGKWQAPQKAAAEAAPPPDDEEDDDE